jgi:hypothetical protein
MEDFDFDFDFDSRCGLMVDGLAFDPSVVGWMEVDFGNLALCKYLLSHVINGVRVLSTFSTDALAFCSSCLVTLHDATTGILQQCCCSNGLGPTGILIRSVYPFRAGIDKTNNEKRIKWR